MIYRILRVSIIKKLHKKGFGDQFINTVLSALINEPKYNPHMYDNIIYPDRWNYNIPIPPPKPKKI